MDWQNDLTRMLKIDYPIIQAPMFGVTTPEMVAASSNINCLGSLSLADLSADTCIEQIRKTKQLTHKPFAVNIFTHPIPKMTAALREKYDAAKAFIERFAQAHDVEVALPSIDDLKIHSYHEQIAAILAEGCKILSFTFGNLDPHSIDLLKSKGIVLIGTCTSVNEAKVLEKSGIDIICVQGLEAGGHRGSFMSDEIPKMGGLQLLAEVREAASLPLIYAGGIYNAKTLTVSKTLGASGYQVGSLLLGASESALKDFEKQRLRAHTKADIVMTKSFSGRYARGIKNIFTEALDNTDLILPYPYQNKLTAALRRVAKEKKQTDFLSIWVGQAIHEYSSQSTASILRDLILETQNYDGG